MGIGKGVRRSKDPETQRRRTPHCVLDRVYEMGPIAVDPCAHPDGLVLAQHYIYEEEDGLSSPWPDAGLAYLNPPYNDIAAWLRRGLAWHEVAPESRELIYLLPANVETAWFQDLVKVHFDLVLAWRGRLTFEGMHTPAQFGSIVCYAGPRSEKFALAFFDKGCYL